MSNTPRHSRRRPPRRTPFHIAAAAVATTTTAAAAAESTATWLAPVSATWNNSSTWSTAPNFPRNDIPPGSTYSAVISATGSPYTVSFDSGYYGFLHNLTLDSPDATLSQNHASMDVSGTFRIDAGTYYLANGTLANATVTGTGGQILFGPSNQDAYLQNVTFDRDLTLNSVPLRITGALTITPGHQINLNADAGQKAMLVLNDHADQALTGAGLQVYLNGPGTAIISKDYNQLTIGPGVTVHANTAGEIHGGANLINQGSILVDAPGQTVQIYGDSLTNQGAIQLAPNSSVTFVGNITNTASISATNATLALNGRFTFASLGAINRSGGAVRFGGILDNTGQSLTSLDAAAGPWEAAGVILGGTVNLPAGQLFLRSGDNLRLTGSTLLSPITVPDGAQVTFTSPSTLGAPLTLASDGANTYLALSGTTPLAGPGEVVFDGSAPKNFLDAYNNTPTLAPTITVRTGSQSGTLRGAFVNQGTISAQTAGKTITFSLPAGSFGGGGYLDNQGTLEARDGGTLTLVSQVTLANLSAATLTGGTYRVLDNSTLNLPGKSIATNAATLYLAGPNSSFPALAPLATNSGSLTLTDGRSFTTQSNLTNTGTLTLGPSSSLTVTGALSNPGTLDLAGGSLTLTTPANSPDSVRQQLLTSHLTSSTATPNHRPGYLLNAPTNTLTVKPTLTGDANLDGALTPDDYTLLDQGLATGGAYWWQGDFNYDGLVDQYDYLLIDTALGQTTHSLSPGLLAQRESQFGAQYVQELITSIPEPASPLACLFAGSLFTRRRTR